MFGYQTAPDRLRDLARVYLSDHPNRKEGYQQLLKIAEYIDELEGERPN